MSDPGFSSTRLTGGCQCGAVRFAATEAPERVSVRYCRMCQKAGGGPFLNLARFPVRAIAWTRGQPAVFRSSTLAARGFCSLCGTPLSYQWRDEACSLTTGAFDDPAALSPTTRFGIEGRLDWTDHLAELPSQTAEDWRDATPGVRGRIVSHQHPDHDT